MCKLTIIKYLFIIMVNLNEKNFLMFFGKGIAFLNKIKYNNMYAGVAEWQTHRTQNATGNRAGSSPATGTTQNP